MNETRYWLWLSLVFGAGNPRVWQLLDHFDSAHDAFFALREGEVTGLAPAEERAARTAHLEQVDAVIEYCQRNGITITAFDQAEYPAILRSIYNPPLVLFSLGHLELLRDYIGMTVVGTRRPSPYSLRVTEALAGGLAECGMTIVSGCALGVDSAAHMGALRAGGKTVGVAACGLNVDYPSGNHPLREDIIKSGVMISEFPLNTPPLAYNFPKRNRILSGMCLGTAVIEAGRKSGALLTARHAYEQNRDVFALPGNITSRNSAGANELIRDGAIPLLDAETILSEYMTRYPELFAAEENTEEDSDTYENGENNVIAAAELFDADASSEEKKILSALLSEPLRIDEIAVKTGIDASRLGAILTMMQIKGKVRRLGENIYTRL